MGKGIFTIVRAGWLLRQFLADSKRAARTASILRDGGEISGSCMLLEESETAPRVQCGEVTKPHARRGSISMKIGGVRSVALAIGILLAGMIGASMPASAHPGDEATTENDACPGDATTCPDNERINQFHCMTATAVTVHPFSETHSCSSGQYIVLDRAGIDSPNCGACRGGSTRNSFIFDGKAYGNLDSAASGSGIRIRSNSNFCQDWLGGTYFGNSRTGECRCAEGQSPNPIHGRCQMTTTHQDCFDENFRAPISLEDGTGRCRPAQNGDESDCAGITAGDNLVNVWEGACTLEGEDLVCVGGGRMHPEIATQATAHRVGTCLSTEECRNEGGVRVGSNNNVCRFPTNKAQCSAVNPDEPIHDLTVDGNCRAASALEDCEDGEFLAAPRCEIPDTGQECIDALNTNYFAIDGTTCVQRCPPERPVRDETSLACREVRAGDCADGEIVENNACAAPDTGQECIDANNTDYFAIDNGNCVGVCPPDRPERDDTDLSCRIAVLADCDDGEALVGPACVTPDTGQECIDAVNTNYFAIDGTTCVERCPAERPERDDITLACRVTIADDCMDGEAVDNNACVAPDTGPECADAKNRDYVGIDDSVCVTECPSARPHLDETSLTCRIAVFEDCDDGEALSSGACVTPGTGQECIDARNTDYVGISGSECVNRCPSNTGLNSAGECVSCGVGEESVENQCVSQCRTNEVRNSDDISICECAANFEGPPGGCVACDRGKISEAGGSCACPRGQLEFAAGCAVPTSCTIGVLQPDNTCAARCPENEVLLPNNTCECARGFERDAGTCVAECNSNQIRVNGVCVGRVVCIGGSVSPVNACACPIGQENDNGTCRPACGTNEIRNASSRVCECAANFEGSSGLCVACTGGKTSEVGGACACPQGQEEFTTGCAAPTICTGSMVLQPDNTCGASCGANEILSNNACACIDGFERAGGICAAACSSSQIRVNGACVERVQCAGGAVSPLNTCVCPGGEENDEGTCRASCGANETRNAARECECDSSSIRIGDACVGRVQCAGGTVSSDNACECPDGQQNDEGTCRPACADLEIRNLFTRACECAAGFERDAGNCVAVCPSTQIRINGICTGRVSCVNGTVSRDNACICPSGQENDEGTCRDACGANETRNAATRACECAADFEGAPGNCVACTGGKTSSAGGSCACSSSERDSGGRCVPLTANDCTAAQKFENGRCVALSADDCSPAERLLRGRCVPLTAEDCPSRCPASLPANATYSAADCAVAGWEWELDQSAGNSDGLAELCHIPVMLLADDSAAAEGQQLSRENTTESACVLRQTPEYVTNLATCDDPSLFGDYGLPAAPASGSLVQRVATAMTVTATADGTTSVRTSISVSFAVTSFLGVVLQPQGSANAIYPPGTDIIAVRTGSALPLARASGDATGRSEESDSFLVYAAPAALVGVIAFPHIYTTYVLSPRFSFSGGSESLNWESGISAEFQSENFRSYVSAAHSSADDWIVAESGTEYSGGTFSASYRTLESKERLEYEFRISSPMEFGLWTIAPAAGTEFQYLKDPEESGWDSESSVGIAAAWAAHRWNVKTSSNFAFGTGLHRLEIERRF